jgi:hypothetical protein
VIIGFSKHGRGEGDRAVGYLTDGMATAIPYLTNATRRGRERTPAPVVLGGNPEITRRLINQVPFTRRYTSGVLSFEEKAVSPEVEQRIMDRFEEAAFAGLPKDNYNMLWVRHTHAGRHELHFLSPAVDLETGKALNINPPRKSTRELFDTLRRLLNDEHGLSDPDDPARARLLRVPSYLGKGKGTRGDLRTTVTRCLEGKLQTGQVKNRDGVLRLLSEAGYTVTRAGEGYITVVDQTGNRCRLKGAVFEKDFAGAPLALPSARLSPEERRELQAKLETLLAARAAFNTKRYGVKTREVEPLEALAERTEHLKSGESHDRTGTSAGFSLRAIDERVACARRDLDAAVARARGGVCAWRGRASALGWAGEELERATGALGEQLGPALARFEERTLTASIYRRYGVRTATPEREEEMVLEQERESYVASV